MASASGTRSTEPLRKMLMLPPNALGFERYRAIIVWSMFAGVSACKLRAILESVSPLATCMVPELEAPAASGGAAVADTACEAARGATDSAGAGIGVGPGLCADGGAAVAAGEPATAGAVTGAGEFGFSPGVYNGGSQHPAYFGSPP